MHQSLSVRALTSFTTCSKDGTSCRPRSPVVFFSHLPSPSFLLSSTLPHHGGRIRLVPWSTSSFHRYVGEISIHGIEIWGRSRWNGGNEGRKGGSAIYPFRFEHHVALDGLDDACAS
eukprot:scaffold1214_cov311-Pavlova_lutheri.AAC.5